MELSYLERVTCLFGISMVLLQVAIELLLWLASPMLLRLLRTLRVRHQERALYLIQLSPFLLALLFTALFCVPRYVSAETNFESEGVGWAGLALALVLYGWGAMRLAAGLRLAVRTARFTRACRLRAGGVATACKHPRIVVAEGPASRIALVGVLRPFILLSRSLLEQGSLGPMALELIFDHERSHATQLDNWKILSLHCLPRLPMKVSGGRTWLERWHETAEWAADDDAVRGSRTRAFALAETLLALARCAAEARPQAICTYFVCESSALAQRVERLIEQSSDQPVPRALRGWLAVGCTAFVVVLMGLWLHVPLGNLPEQLLHLG